MFENSIAKIISVVAPKTYKMIFNLGANDQRQKAQEQKEKDRELKKEAKLISFDQKFPMGSFVVAIPNEAENPVIGRIVNYFDLGSHISDPIMIVYDYVRCEEIAIPCFTMPYSEAFLKAVMAQDVYQRHLSYYRNEKNFQSISDDLIESYDDLVILLEKNNFYHDLKAK